MSSATQKWMHGSVEQLLAQRERYALAVRSAKTNDARDRHLRTVARLDDEIEGMSEALYSLSRTEDDDAGVGQSKSAALRRPALLERPVADVVLTGPYARLDGTSHASDWRALSLWVGIAFVAGFGAIALWLN